MCPTNILKAGVQSGLDLLFPRACTLCSQPAAKEFHYLCWDCRTDIHPIARPFCEQCGDPVFGRIDHAWLCGYCTARPVHFSRARSSVRYSGAIMNVLQAFKYQNATWLSHDLVDLLDGCLAADFDSVEYDLVTAVPLSPAKFRRRSYNQSSILGRGLAQRLGIAFLPQCLTRVRDTQSQTKLKAKQRLKNVKGAFKAGHTSWLKGRRVLLVDDIMTTGATVNECARALRQAGANDVQVITVARG